MPEEIEKIRRELEEAKKILRIKDQRIADASKEIQDLQGKLDTLQRERPKLAPENLIASFKTALVNMQEGLKIGEGRVEYIISKFDTDLRVAVTLDEQGNLNFQLPKMEDIIPFENLSTVRFSITPVPRPPAPPPETVEVPSVLGMPKDAAVESIQAAKFKVGTIEERTSVSTPGTVIRQSPDRYSRAKIGTPIDLVISRVREAKVPNVVGMDKDDAVEVIRSARLAAGEVAEEISASPPGTVISQSIPADTVVPVETSIDLLIAKTEIVTVPDVVGKGVKEAIQTIERAKLKVGQVAEKLSEGPNDTVIEQSPESGKKVPVDTAIDITLSKPKTVVVPNLIGLGQKEAEGVASETLLKIGKIVRRRSRKLEGTVIGQKPIQGVRVSAGESIRITVSTGWHHPR